MWKKLGKTDYLWGKIRAKREPRPLCSMYFVYILRWERNNTFYIGYTDDLTIRVKEHRREGNLKLIYYEAYQLEKLTRQREKRLKCYGSAWRALKKRSSA